MTTTVPAQHRAANAFAGQVSRAIRETVIRPLPSGTPRDREGVRVSRFAPDSAGVAIDIDAPGARRRMTTAITEALTEAGYTVETASTGDGFYASDLLTVTR